MPWRGIYSGLPIEFKIDDKDFLEQVYDQEIKFGNGTSITCNLQIETKTTIKDDIEEAKTYYIVKLITQWSDDEHFQYDTKKYKKIKKIAKTPKSLYLIKKNDSKVEKLVCKKLFGKKLSKGKYKIKWIQSKKFTIE